MKYILVAEIGGEELYAAVPDAAIVEKVRHNIVKRMSGSYLNRFHATNTPVVLESRSNCCEAPTAGKTFGDENHDFCDACGHQCGTFEIFNPCLSKVLTEILIHLL